MCFFNGHVRQIASVPEALLSPLQQRIADSRGLWDQADASKPNRFACFPDTRHIVFQFPDDLSTHLVSSYSALWPDWEALIRPIIGLVTQGYGYHHGRTARIMLANVRPGGIISRHVDQMASADVPHKIHVPVITHPKVRFFEGEAAYFLQRGLAYEVNNKIPHGVQNGSTLERVHLIFDYYDCAESASGSRF